MTDLLLLIGEDAADVPVISALCQDMTVRVADLGHDTRARRFAVIGNRYRWEASKRTRARAVLRFDNVLRVQRRGWPAAPDAVLALLSISATDDHLTLDFSGGASVRLTVDAIDIVLEDVSGPWGTKRAPKHDD